MMDFFEYAVWRRRTGLPDAVTMLRKAGIDPHGPHEVEVMKMVKDEKRRAARAPRRPVSSSVSLSQRTLL